MSTKPLASPINVLLDQASLRAGKRWEVVAAGAGLLKVIDPACDGNHDGHCWCATFINDSYAYRYARLQSQIGTEHSTLPKAVCLG